MQISAWNKISEWNFCEIKFRIYAAVEKYPLKNAANAINVESFCRSSLLDSAID